METTVERITSFDEELISELFRKIDECNIEPSGSFFTSDRNILLVSKTDGQLSGFLFGYVLDSLKTPYPKLFLYSIDVFVEYQRRGIARLLIDELKKLAVQYDCSEIFVLTEEQNNAAMNLYRDTGGVRENDDDVMFIYDRNAF